MRADHANAFILDIGSHARYLITLPLLVLAEALCAPRLTAIARQFVATGLIAEADRPTYELYWESVPGQPPSPAGPGLAAANAEGYAVTGTLANPYHGYLFRILTSQGPDAEGGGRDYLVDGKLGNGFALLTYPSAHGASGVMTFMVNQDGVVWQRDLGADTAQAAAAIQQFNPDNSWTPLAPEG
jgi:hypothetical protein